MYVLLYYCTALLLTIDYCTTLLLYYCTIVLLYYCTIVLVCWLRYIKIDITSLMMSEAIFFTALEKENHVGKVSNVLWMNGELKNISIENYHVIGNHTSWCTRNQEKLLMKNINLKLLFPNINKFVFIKHSNPFGNAISGPTTTTLDFRKGSSS